MARLKETWNTFTEGFIRQTPPLFTALGLCPALAITTTATNGLVMGLSTTAVLVGAALIALAFRNVIPKQVRIPVYTVGIATLVTVVDFLLEGLLPEIHALLGLFIPLIIVNCIVLGRVEAAFTRMKPLPALGDAFGYGLGFTWALTFIGVIREVMAAGTIFGAQVLPDGVTAWQIMRTPPGGFLTMAFLFALIQTIRMQLAKRRSRQTPQQVQAA